MSQVIGIDLCGSLIKAARFDENGELLSMVETGFTPPLMPGAVTVQLCEIIEEIDSDSQALMVGIVLPATIDSLGRVVKTAQQFSGWDEVPLSEWLELRIKRKVTLANLQDISLMAELDFMQLGFSSDCLKVAFLAFKRFQGFSYSSFRD